MRSLKRGDCIRRRANGVYRMRILTAARHEKLPVQLAEVMLTLDLN